MFDVMSICLEVSETNEYIKAIYTKQWNENLLLVIVSLLQKPLRQYVVYQSITYVLYFVVIWQSGVW